MLNLDFIDWFPWIFGGVFLPHSLIDLNFSVILYEFEVDSRSRSLDLDLGPIG